MDIIIIERILLCNESVGCGSYGIGSLIFTTTIIVDDMTIE